MSAVMTREQVRAARDAALGRRGDRRQEYKTYSVAEERAAWVEGRTLPRIDLHAPSLRPPETLAEFFDDRVVAHSALEGFPETPALVALAEAARDGADAAVKAVRAARGLSRPVQWVCWQNIELWRKHQDAPKTGADAVVLRVEREWSRLKLPEQDPAEQAAPKRRRRRWETEAEATA